MTDSAVHGHPGLRRDAQRNLERVLQQAAVVFAEHGLSATLADVAKAAGVGVGTLYRRFQDKDDLILAVYQSRMDAAVELTAGLSTRSDPAAAFRELIESGARDFRSDRGFRELVLGGLTDSVSWTRSGTSTALGDAVDRMNTAVSSHLAVLIARGRDTGTLRGDLEPTDLQLINTAVHSVAGFADAARPGIHLRLVEMIMQGVLPRDDAGPMTPAPLTEDELSRAVRDRRRPEDGE